MIKIIILIYLFTTSILCGTEITLNDKIKQQEILSQSQIYIDYTKKMTITDITRKEIVFNENYKSLLGYGYSPDFNVWIKFSLKNNSPNTIHKILEYGNTLTTHIDFYDTTLGYIEKDGVLQIKKDRKTINPIFNIELKAYESRVYYIKASSFVTTLIIKLNLWDQQSFYNKELEHQFYLALFFGAMAILAIYNFFIFIFSKDISYLFYVLYILGVIYHQSIYTGVLFIYFISSDVFDYVINFGSLAGMMPVLFLAFFSKYFLKTKQYPIFYKILNFLLIVTPIVILIPILTDYWDTSRNVMSLILLIFVLILSIYATYKKNRQAYFILAGWIIVFIAVLLMYLSSKGIFNVYEYFPYIIEVAFISEAVLFSIALSDKINGLQNEKNNVHQELILQKKTENQRLEIQVEEKTKDLNISLKEKTLLLKELNHRVKNNMQMIISLIRLQTDDIEDEHIQNLFITTQNRLNAMSQLHELLYQRDNISYINAYEYFTTLIEGLQETYYEDVNINYFIDGDLQIEQAISCGIIVNEIVTNALKYAFYEDVQGSIDITLFKNDVIYTLIIKDNGKGYNPEVIKKSFGLTLVKTLVESKLKGKIFTKIKQGVEVKITWREEYE